VEEVLAKRRNPGAPDAQGPEPSAAAAADALGDFAADLGRFLGQVQNKATSWLEQRKAISDQLTQIRDTANQYLQQLHGARQTAVAAGRAVRAGAARAAASAGARAKRTMSPEARERIAAAQRKRWAKVRREQGK
jgi:hypothetical protein